MSLLKPSRDCIVAGGPAVATKTEISLLLCDEVEVQVSRALIGKTD